MAKRKKRYSYSSYKRYKKRKRRYKRRKLSRFRMSVAARAVKKLIGKAEVKWIYAEGVTMNVNNNNFWYNYCLDPVISQSVTYTGRIGQKIKPKYYRLILTCNDRSLTYFNTRLAASNFMNRTNPAVPTANDYAMTAGSSTDDEAFFAQKQVPTRIRICIFRIWEPQLTTVGPNPNVFFETGTPIIDSIYRHGWSRTVSFQVLYDRVITGNNWRKTIKFKYGRKGINYENTTNLPQEYKTYLYWYPENDIMHPSNPDINANIYFRYTDN